MTDQSKILEQIIALVQEVAEDDSLEVTADSALIGENAIVSSRQLVEILLAVEEYAEDDLGVEFNWASDAAMSTRRSVLRTPGTLAEQLASLQSA